MITNNDGTESFYKQGVYNNLNGELIEGSIINNLWKEKLNCKLEDGDIEITEWLNGKKHGPVIVYDFYGEVNQYYFSNGEKIFLL